MEMAALLVFERQALEEQIGEPRFAPAYATPDVNAPFEFSVGLACQQSLQQIFGCRLAKASSQIIEEMHHFQLGTIPAIAQSIAFMVIKLDEAALQRCI
jgi:hypothetical protein